MTECLTNKYSAYALLSKVQDRLGWDNFVESRISTLWLDTVEPFLRHASRKSIQQWGKSFIDSLLSLTHKQWIFRNSKVHFKTDGLTASQHDVLETTVRTLMATQPSSLLAKDRYLLSEDFTQLGEGPAVIRQVWVASMESALGAAAKHAEGQLVPGSHPHLRTRHYKPQRFTRHLKQPCIRRPPTEDASPSTCTHTPTAASSPTKVSLQQHLQNVQKSRKASHTTPRGTIRLRRRDTGSCIYKNDWRIK